MSVLSHERSRWSSWLPSELRWLSKQIRPLLYWHVASFLCITVGSLLALLTPLVLRWLIDQILPQKKMGLLLLAVGLIFLGYQGRMALTSVGNFLMLTASQKMGLALRMSLLRHLDTLSADYYENTPVGATRPAGFGPAAHGSAASLHRCPPESSSSLPPHGQSAPAWPSKRGQK